MSEQLPPVSRHFHVPARELLLARPVPCPYWRPLSFDGMAVTSDERHHLIVSLASSVRAYLGPDLVTVERRVEILVAGLQTRPGLRPPALADAAREWVRQCWEAMLDELVSAWTAGR